MSLAIQVLSIHGMFSHTGIHVRCHLVIPETTTRVTKVALVPYHLRMLFHAQEQMLLRLLQLSVQCSAVAVSPCLVIPRPQRAHPSVGCHSVDQRCVADRQPQRTARRSAVQRHSAVHRHNVHRHSVLKRHSVVAQHRAAVRRSVVDRQPRIRARRGVLDRHRLVDRHSAEDQHSAEERPPGVPPNMTHPSISRH